MAKTKEVNQKQAVAVAPVGTGDPAIDTARQDVLHALATVEPLLGQPMDGSERIRLVKVRRSGQQLIVTFVGLASLKPGLAPPGMDPAVLATNLTQYQQMVVLSNAATGLAKRLADAVAERQAALWTDALTLYGIAQHWKGDDMEVQTAVAQMKAALAIGPLKSKDGTPKKSGKSKKTAPVTTAAPAPAAGSPAQSTGPATTGTGNGTQQVPLYGPDGPEGTVPATNPAKAGS